MTRLPSPWLAIALLERVVPDSAPLAGDLIEEFERRGSHAWLWWQVLGAVAASWLREPVEIRPLRLVELQPADAIERARKFMLRARPVNMSASPLPEVGGLGLFVLVALSLVVVPGAWVLVLGSALGGALLGGVLISVHARAGQATTTGPSSFLGQC